MTYNLQPLAAKQTCPKLTSCEAKASCEARTTLHKAKLTAFSKAKRPKITKEAKPKASQGVVLQTSQPLKKSWFDNLPAASVNMVRRWDNPRRSRGRKQGLFLLLLLCLILTIALA